VRGEVLTNHDSWGQDFLLENPALRHDCPGVALTYTEIEFIPISALNEAVAASPSEVPF
jgi:hypothetical protein